MSFSEIKGQDKPISFIQSALKENRLASAYLFVGPKGVGKGLTAKNFAKAVNCLRERFDACDDCESCLKIDKLNHPDVHYLESQGSSYLKIEDIRQIQEQVCLKPFEARKKVFIIKDVEALTSEAANCFLKTLEEPPQDTLFILTTAKLNLLFATIISRCQKVYFSALGRSSLENILTREYGLDEKTSHYLAYFNEGRLGSALEKREQNVLSEKNRIIDSLLFNRQASAINLDKRDEAIGALEIMLSWFRDIYLLKNGTADSELIHLDRRRDVYDLANKYSLFRLEEIIQILDNYILYLNENVNIKLILNLLRERLWTR